MAVYEFSKDSTPPMPGSHLDRARRLASDGASFADALASGEAWRRFCDGLRAAGDSILGSQDATSPADLAEGYQFLLGAVAALLEAELYRTDAASPAFLRTQTDVVKLAMDNPDGALMSAPLSDDGIFEIYGSVGQIRLLELVISGGRRPEMHYLHEFEVGTEGELRITLSRDKRPGNWIGLPPGAKSVLVRRATYDWDSEEVPHLAIRRLDGEAGVLPWCLRVPTPAEMGEQLDALGTLVSENIDYWVDMVHSFRDDGDNVIQVPRPLASTGLNSARSSVKGFFVVPRDQALIIEFTPPEGVFWSVSLGDIWFRTFNFSHYQTSLNGHQVELDPDGVCRVVVAHHDPGVPNWLDTIGHEQGVIVIRWVMVSDRPQPELHLVPFTDVESSVHPQTRRMSAEERAATISRRRDAVAKRLAVPVTTRWSYSTSEIDPPRP
jgi:hypothetical protein